jgi:hypothetical protein
MRRLLGGIVFGVYLAACGGSDFAAGTPDDDAGADGASGDTGAPSVPDSSTPTDAVTEQDGSFPQNDAPNESRADDGVNDGPGDRVDEEITASESGLVDATPDRTVDAPADAPLDASEASVDATTDVASTTCDAPTTFYRDRDKDGFGATAEHVLACTAPPGDDWSTRPGDCRDDLPNVKPFVANSPDGPMYSGSGYADPVKPQGISFDFDCDGTETADPTNMYGAAQACGNLSTNCGQIGYLPADPARSGVGINGLCGSTTLRICAAQGLACNAMFAQTTPYRCR